ncbi:hypothetical protein MKX03_007317 [Papaver bracteatum]|nr:hypothetical protein MKX03_007317 [Papaver bracteatum]
MALQNIGAGNNDDAFYRYKMPRMLTKIEVRGNGIIILLDNFIKKFVQCYGCGNPETEVIITKTKMIQLKCAACGFVSDVDIRDKLTAFIAADDNVAREEEEEEDDDARKRIQEQLSAVTADMVMLTTVESKKEKPKPAAKKVEVTKKKNYLAAATHENKGSQILLLRAIDVFCEKSVPEVVKEVALVLKRLYDEDVLEEEYIVQQIWKNVNPFIVWLQSAESESELE